MKSAIASITSLLRANRDALGTVRDGLEALRRQNRETREAIADVDGIPCDEAAAHARIDKLVEGWVIGVQSRSYVPSPAALTASPANYNGLGLAFMEPALATYLAPSLAAAMKAEASKHLGKHPGITSAERAARLDKLDRQLLDLELAEESIVRNAIASGLPVHRRARADPRAVMAADSELPQ